MKICVLTTVWPEPDSSAVGVRLLQWIELFLGFGWGVTVASPGRPLSADKRPLPKGVDQKQLQLNRSDQDQWWKDSAFDFVIFERFTTEEQFGFRIKRLSPKTIQILETVDIHFLRRQRERGSPCEEDELRERSSAARCDLSIVCSFAEREILASQGTSRVEVVPFFYPDPVAAITREGSSTEQACVFIGNFRHPPNREGITWFVDEVWPQVRRSLPDAALYIAGAYPTRSIHALENLKTRVRVLGAVDDLDRFFAQGVVNVAPLPFGAGIKGKILEGWRRGLPCVSTSMGAEGFCEDGKFGGLIADSPEEFARATIQLLQDPGLRQEKAEIGLNIIRDVHSLRVQKERIRKIFADAAQHCSERRRENWVGRALQLSLNRSTEYFSRWIELKETSELKERNRNQSSTDV